MISSNEVPCHQLEGVKLSLYTANEIKNLSVKRITNPETFDSLLHPNYGGLYDPSLGPTDRDDLCETCGQNSVYCPGHMGHIELPLPVYHPLFMKILIQILRSSCFCCHKLLLTKTSKHTYTRSVCNICSRGGSRPKVNQFLKQHETATLYPTHPLYYHVCSKI